MTGDTTMAKVSRLEVIETGARRRWTLEEKLRIIEESYRGPRLVSSTARRHGLSVNQLFVWRRLYREGKLGEEGPGFVPAVVSADGAMACNPQAGRGRIEIILSEPRRLIVDGEVDGDALARLVSALGRR
jgi:transposase